MKQAGKRYWRSLDELADSPELRRRVERESPSLASQIWTAASRRDFLKAMGASLALGSLTGCRWPKEKIVPYAHRPEGRVPGKPEQFATAMELAGVARALLVTSYDGRPLKVEGNPEHPESRGASDAYAQASVLELYDPDRSKDVVLRQNRQRIVQTWDQFDAFAKAAFSELRRRGGDGFSVLSEASSSPSLYDMRARLQQALPMMTWYEYEPVSRDNERLGTAMAFGRPCRAHPALDQADVILSLDSDLLMNSPVAVKHAMAFASRRRAEDFRMNRLYVVEPVVSVTGAMADHRCATPSRLVPRFACKLAGELTSDPALGTAADKAALAPLLQQTLPAMPPFFADIVRDLRENRGRSLVVAGPRQNPGVHALAAWLNHVLGNAGKTITYTAEVDPDRPAHVDAMRALVSEMKAGRVDTLLVLGGNPVYNAPADLEFAQQLDRVKTLIRVGLYEDETSLACDWHLPQAHFLESWGDARAYDGTISIVQPLIDPLYDGRTPIEILATALDEEPRRCYDIVRRTFGRLSSAADVEPAWRRALHDGLVEGTRFKPDVPMPLADALSKAIEGIEKEGGGSDASPIEVVFVQDHSVHDGRYANSGWLQEMPDPLTKLTWDNAAAVSPALAREQNLTEGDVVRISCDGTSIEAPVVLLPGQATGSIALPLGYGRRAAGRVGTGVGVDAYNLRPSTAMYTRRADLMKTGRRYPLAATQDHFIIDPVGHEERERRSRELIRELTLAEYKAGPRQLATESARKPRFSLWREHEYEGHRWAMAIDLSVCTGCSACVVACQAENNVPVVGKDQVKRGREMHWIRVDRYFSGDPDSPSISFQPLTCHHCEDAPCEQVCPVGATQHSHEGLNDMVYNRCVGTRYCSNNCPYKVRRFNWFNNLKRLSDFQKMQLNPEVTVRSRGVMEKCTFCVQRINLAKIAAKNDRRALVDGGITPACAQACPTGAIVFGDLNDAESRVAKLHASGRSYALLEELNIKPRTKYLARLRNPAERT
ncbi:MAG: TAT-variant-translocated molybdopterin oxidoreductase [Acidobacteriota bacterium]